LNDKIINHKNFDKRANETNKKSSEKKYQTKINIITIEKNHKFDLNGKIKNYKNSNKRDKGKKTKKSEVERPNRKTSYTQIRIEGLNCKQIKLQQKRK
jgi:hypothetical protein